MHNTINKSSYLLLFRTDDVKSTVIQIHELDCSFFFHRPCALCLYEFLLNVVLNQVCTQRMEKKTVSCFPLSSRPYLCIFVFHTAFFTAELSIDSFVYAYCFDPFSSCEYCFQRHSLAKSMK